MQLSVTRLSRYLVPILAVSAMTLSISSAEAIGIFVPLKPKDNAPFLKSLDVSGEVENNISRTRITQVYHNPNPHPVEADFYFPVPDGADITDFVLYMNGKPVKGEVLGKSEAQKIYKDIVRKLKDPGLVEYAEKNLFRVRVFPIPANGDQKLEIEVSQALTADQGYFRYFLPTESGRHNAASTAPPTVSIKVHLKGDSPIRNVYSPTHEVKIKQDDPKNVTVSENGSMSGQRKAFILYYEASKKDIAVSLLAHRVGDEPGFFSLRISPPWESDSTTASKGQSGDYLFVIDTSGSMSSGDKIDQARKALRYCVNLLGDKDRFNIIRFSTSVDPFKEKLTPASKSNRASAKSWIDGLEARGATNISEALKRALQQRSEDLNTGEKSGESHRMFTVVFLTDGLPTVGETSTDAIIKSVEKESGGNVRIFTFGIGNDVNTRLLDTIADSTRAASDYVAPSADLEVPVSRFFDKVSRPALFNLQLKIPKADITEVYPVELPDLFYGTELAVFGRYKKSGKSPIILSGTVAGEKREYRFEKNFPTKADSNPFIEKLWATRKVAYLLDQVRKAGESDELRKEIETLASKYNIVTPYTSYLAMDDQDKSRARARNTAGPVPASVPSGGRMMYNYEATNGTASRGDIYRTDGAKASRRSLALESGAAAVQSAKQINSMKRTDNLSKANAQNSVRRIVNGKTFNRNTDVWMDAAITGNEKEIIKIKYLSDAWFQLSDDFDNMRDFLALGEQVQIRLTDNLILIIGMDGIDFIDVATESKLKNAVSQKNK